MAAVALQRRRLAVDVLAHTSSAVARGVEAGRSAPADTGEPRVVDVPGRCVWTTTGPSDAGHRDVDRHADGMLMPMGVGVDVAALL